MSSSSSTQQTGGIGFTGLLQIVFITLKLLGKLDWSWWWVWSPTLISLGFLVLFIVVYMAVVVYKESK